MKHLGNITQITGDTIAPVNVIIGGSPCQDLSSAGKRAGLAGERSGLFTEQIRIVKEMRKNMEQITLDSWCGKTSQEPCPATRGRTSGSSSKKQRELQKQMPLFLDLRKGNGRIVDASWEMGGALLGEYSMHSFGESPSVAVESHLWQILEENPHPKYYLSAKACQGILRRAEKRKEELPEMLKNALIRQYMTHEEMEVE